MVLFVQLGRTGRGEGGGVGSRCRGGDLGGLGRGGGCCVWVGSLVMVGRLEAKCRLPPPPRTPGATACVLHRVSGAVTA